MGKEGAGGLAGLATPIGVGMQVLGAGFSIARAIKQRQEQREAERQARVAFDQAKSKLEVNRMEGLQVPLDSYEQAMRETTAQQMQSLEGLREADARSLAAGVGRLGAAAADTTERNRQMMDQALYERDKAIISEQSDIDQKLANLSLNEAVGARQAAADAQAASTMNLQQGIMGIGNAFNTLAQSQDLYSKRQGQIDAAEMYQKQTGEFAGMSPVQAYRAMKAKGFGDEEFSNLLVGKKIDGSPFETKSLFTMPEITPFTPQPFSFTGLQAINR